MPPRKQHGFTLVEIAIVLVIIGLLLGGILKGQELITSARVRNLITQIDGVKTAFYGFQDRYRALPGDFTQADSQIPGETPGNTNIDGNGNAIIEGPNTPANAISGTLNTKEATLVWDHLSHAGFLNGTYVYNATQSPNTTPTNPWGAYMDLEYDDWYADNANQAGANLSDCTVLSCRHNFKTGNQIPVNILAEVDRKIDDGNPLTGTVRFSTYNANGSAPTAATCIQQVTNNGVTSWVWLSGAGTANCGAAILY